MKILIACEESQEVCKAFRELGFDTYSCDLQECSGGKPEWHIVGDGAKEALLKMFTPEKCVEAKGYFNVIRKD